MPEYQLSYCQDHSQAVRQSLIDDCIAIIWGVARLP